MVADIAPGRLKPTGEVRGRRLSVPPSTLVATAVVVVTAGVGLLAPWLAPYDPARQGLNSFAGPSDAHWLGTDSLGRDVLSRVLYAIRTDLLLIIPAAGIPMVVGTAIGSVAAYFGGITDAAVRWFADVVQGLPVYILLIALVTTLGQGTWTLIAAFTILGWVTYARIARTEVRRVREENYVAASYMLGRSHAYVLRRHVVPNSIRQTLAYFSVDLGMTLQTITVLTFFNLGVSAGTPELGAMVADGQAFIQGYPWLVTIPGLVIVLLGVSLAVIGDAVSNRGGVSPWSRVH